MLIYINVFFFISLLVIFNLLHIRIHALQLIIHDFHDTVQGFIFLSFTFQLILLFFLKERHVILSFDFIISFFFFTLRHFLVTFFNNSLFFNFLRELLFEIVRLTCWFLVHMVLTFWLQRIIQLMEDIFEEVSVIVCKLARNAFVINFIEDVARFFYNIFI